MRLHHLLLIASAGILFACGEEEKDTAAEEETTEEAEEAEEAEEGEETE